MTSGGKRPGAGRPRSPASKRRDKMLAVKVTAKELAAIKRLARLAGCSVGELTLAALHDKYPTLKPREKG